MPSYSGQPDRRIFPQLSGLGDLRLLRRQLREFLRDCTQDSLIDAVLVASELATKACRCGRPPFEVRVVRDCRRLGIEVDDSGWDGLVGTPDSVARCDVVGKLAVRWGISHRHGRRTLWAELPLASRVSALRR